MQKSLYSEMIFPLKNEINCETFFIIKILLIKVRTQHQNKRNSMYLLNYTHNWNDGVTRVAKGQVVGDEQSKKQKFKSKKLLCDV